jgi:hypothetical protein
MGGAAARETTDKLFARNGWKLKLPNSPLLLVDARLLEPLLQFLGNRKDGGELRRSHLRALPAVLSWLAWVLGQALGHICFGHTRIALLRDLIFAGYWRAATTSGDRAGILAWNSVAKALCAQVKISVGTNQINEVHAQDFIERAFKVSQSLTRVQAMLIRWRSTVPPLITRLENMVAWAGLPPMRER